MTKIKVIGVGGSGSNAVSRMASCKVQGVDLVAVNTDLQDLKKTRADFRIQIGKELTGGLGTGMNPDLGRRAAEEQQKEIEEILKGTDMVFVTGGFGGGTCSGAAPVIAEMSKAKKILTAAIITKPFSFEGTPRMRIAEQGLEKLKDKVDTLVVIPNDKILSMIGPDTTLLSAFWLCDEILRQAVQGISDLILVPGIINIDFADVRAVIENAGRATFGQGKARGENRVEEAVNAALNSPLVDFPIYPVKSSRSEVPAEGGQFNRVYPVKSSEAGALPSAKQFNWVKGAKGVLFNVSGGDDLSLTEIDQAAKIITKNVDPQAKIIFGAVKDPKLKKGEIKIMLIATGF